jgi:hypothetical protein
MKNILQKTFSLIVILLALAPTAVVFAQSTAGQSAPATGPITTYAPLEPNAFKNLGITTTDGKLGIADLPNFLSKVFDFGIALAAALAVIMIAIGGIEYMTTDSWFGKEDGKKKVNDALMGLGLALISWLILWTINPCLVDFTNASCANKILTPPTAQNK